MHPARRLNTGGGGSRSPSPDNQRGAVGGGRASPSLTSGAGDVSGAAGSSSAQLPVGGTVTPSAMIPVQSLTLYTSNAAATSNVERALDFTNNGLSILLDEVLTDDSEPCEGTIKTTPPAGMTYAETLIVAGSGEVIGRESVRGGATVGDRVTVYTRSAKILRLIQKAADRGGTNLDDILDDAPATPENLRVSLRSPDGAAIPVLTRGGFLLGGGPLSPAETVTVYVRSFRGRDALMARVSGAASGKPLRISDLLVENPRVSRLDQVTLEAPERGFAVNLITQVGYVLGLADNQPLLGQRQHFLRD